MIRRIFRFLGSGIGITLMVAVALSLALWFLGGFLAFGEARPFDEALSRLVGLAVLWIAALVVILILLLVGRKRDDKLVAEIVAPTATAGIGEDETVKAELVEMRSKLKAALATGRAELRPNAIAARIETDPDSGRATGVTYIDAVTRQRVTVAARAVSVCASTIESVRLLQMSDGARHPRGLGNSSGNLGRYLSDHLMVFRAGTLPRIEGMGAGHDPYDFGQQSGIYIPSFRNRTGPDGLPFLRGYSLLGSVGRLSPGWFFMAIGEVLPRADNRVELDGTKRDAWGLPVAKVTLTHGENERAMISDMNSVLKDLSQTFGLPDDLLGRESLISRLVYKIAGPLVYTPEGALIPGSSIHETGGACMGADPARHVTDARNRLYDCPNIWVTDSASFPTNPFHNPGLTIMALSARAGADIAATLKG